MTTIKFILFSDIHCGVPQNEKTNNEIDNISRIVTLCKNGNNKPNLGNDIRYIVIGGDLTKDGKTEELIQFKELYKQLSPYTNIYIIPGNHDDSYPEYRDTIKYIRDINGFSDNESVNFVKINQGLYHFCCGLKPNIDWIKQQFNNYNITNKTPLVFSFHFNLEGPYSDWWNDDEKTQFYNTIKDYNILLIHNGHWHTDKIGTWTINNGKKINYVISAGNKICLCTYNIVSKNLSFKLI